MNRRIFPLVFVLALISVCLTTAAQETHQKAKPAPPTTPTAKAKQEIEAAIQSYMAAFNERDVEKLVGHWSPDGVYISRTSGERSVGREAMSVEFKKMFAGDNVPKLASKTHSIDFISPNVALERGSATVTYGDKDVANSEYTVVFVRRDGKWLIDRVSEEELLPEPENYQQLKALEWLIGEWVDVSDEVTIEISCAWTKNQNFISRRYTVSSDTEVVSSGLQIIGWDAKQKKIRSWLFDSDGGFVSGEWAKNADQWTVQSVATLADGGTGSFTSIYKLSNDGNYTWQKVNRVLDGKLLPNLDQVLIQRK